MRSGSRGLEVFHASNAADASANSARVAAFRNGIHIEEWRRGNCVVQQQSGTRFGTLYAALICLARNFFRRVLANLAYGFMASENVALIGFADHIAGG